MSMKSGWEPQGKFQPTRVKQPNVSTSSPTCPIIKSKRINRDIRAWGILSELVVYTSDWSRGGKSLQWRRAAWDCWGRSELVNPNLDMRVGQETDPKLQWQCCQSGWWWAHRSEHRGLCWCHCPHSQGSQFWHQCRSCLCGFANLTQLSQTEGFCFACMLIKTHSQKSLSTDYWKLFFPKASARQLFCKAASSLSLCGIFWP